MRIHVDLLYTQYSKRRLQSWTLGKLIALKNLRSPKRRSVVGGVGNEINIISDLKDRLYSSASVHVLYNEYLRCEYCVRGGLSSDVCGWLGCTSICRRR